jgi:CDP-glucose 4,6-dehydratase
VRPWQHVFDCLSGYLMLIDHMLETGESGDFNFASEPSAFKTVRDLILSLENLSNQDVNFSQQEINFKETQLLTLNSDKAKKIIKFENKLNFEDSLKLTYDWYKLFYDKNDMSKQSLVQVENHLELISLKNI